MIGLGNKHVLVYNYVYKNRYKPEEALVQIFASFGRLLKERRRALDLTQEELARRVGCASITIKKIEAETLRPSRQIAERLATVLDIAPEDHPEFVRLARTTSRVNNPPTPSLTSRF